RSKQPQQRPVALRSHGEERAELVAGHGSPVRLVVLAGPRGSPRGTGGQRRARGRVVADQALVHRGRQTRADGREDAPDGGVRETDRNGGDGLSVGVAALLLELRATMPRRALALRLLVAEPAYEPGDVPRRQLHERPAQLPVEERDRVDLQVALVVAARLLAETSTAPAWIAVDPVERVGGEREPRLGMVDALPGVGLPLGFQQPRSVVCGRR